MTPPVIDRPSAAGQAPWRMPLGVASGGVTADAARVGDLEVRAGSIVGPGHRCEEPALPRQDAYALGRSDGVLVVAVADGVSQSARADLGARVAASAATRLVLEDLDEHPNIGLTDVPRLFDRVSGEIIGTGAHRGIPPADLCTVLMVATIPTSPGRDGTRVIHTARVGDVALWVCKQDVLSCETGGPAAGIDRNTHDEVLPFDCTPIEHDFSLEAGARLAVVSDGVHDTLTNVNGGTEHFANLWAAPPPHPVEFLEGLSYDAPGQLDDRAAVVVWLGAGIANDTDRNTS